MLTFYHLTRQLPHRHHDVSSSEDTNAKHSNPARPSVTLLACGPASRILGSSSTPPPPRCLKPALSDKAKKTPLDTHSHKDRFPFLSFLFLLSYSPSLFQKIHIASLACLRLFTDQPETWTWSCASAGLLLDRFLRCLVLLFLYAGCASELFPYHHL